MATLMEVMNLLRKAGYPEDRAGRAGEAPMTGVEDRGACCAGR